MRLIVPPGMSKGRDLLCRCRGCFDGWLRGTLGSLWLAEPEDPRAPMSGATCALRAEGESDDLSRVFLL